MARAAPGGGAIAPPRDSEDPFGAQAARRESRLRRSAVARSIPLVPAGAPTLTGYERYMAVLEGRPVDFLPRLPILMGFAAQFIGSDYAAFASDWRVLVEANVRCAEAFGFDQLSAISDPYRETQGFGAEIEYVKDGVPRCLRPPLEDTKDLTVLKKPDPRRSPRMLDRVRAIEEYARLFRGKYSIMGWIEGPAAEAADLRGVTTFLFDLMDDPEFASRLMELCTEVGIGFAWSQLEAGADTIGIGDAIASQLPPGLYAERVLPLERRMVEAIHSRGGRVRLHICGNITHLLPHMSSLGADIVDLDWQVDMREARRVLPPSTALCGNLDPVSAVKDSTPDEIRRRVVETYRSIGDPYMVGAGCEIPMGTPHENLSALCAEVAQGGTARRAGAAGAEEVQR